MPDNLLPENDESLSLNLSGMENLEKKDAPLGFTEPKAIVIPVEQKQERMILNQNPDRQSIKQKINLTKPPKPQREKRVEPIIAEVKNEINVPPALEIPEISAKISVEESKSKLEMPELFPEKKIVPIDLDDFPSIIMREEDLDLRLELPKKEVKKKENKVVDKVGKEVIAWLILHTENQEPTYFDLFEGVNVIGRGEPQRPADVEIHNDQYVSRFHAYLKIFQTPQKIFLYALYDGAFMPPKPSLNGVYVNGNKDRLRANDAHYLRDGDTVQIGLTKMVFKSQEMTGNIEDACTQVLQTEYTQTVIIR